MLLPTLVADAYTCLPYLKSNPPASGYGDSPRYLAGWLRRVYEEVLSSIRLVLSSSCLASAQSTEPQSRDNTATRYDEPHRNWSWFGLLGLAGLAWLARRKSETAQRFESRGVKVNAV
jgi:MYXO-CTERM domain-containing protein